MIGGPKDRDGCQQAAVPHSTENISPHALMAKQRWRHDDEYSRFGSAWVRDAADRLTI
jgi:hypothetical protein